MPSPEPAHRADVAPEFPPYRSVTAAQAHAGARSAWKRPSTSSCPPAEITFGIVAIANGYGGWRLPGFCCATVVFFTSDRHSNDHDGKSAHGTHPSLFSGVWFRGPRERGRGMGRKARETGTEAED